MKDTVIVPSYGRVTVDMVADQPGLTLFHCHIQQHMDYGFKALSVTYEPGTRKATIRARDSFFLCLSAPRVDTHRLMPVFPNPIDLLPHLPGYSLLVYLIARVILRGVADFHGDAESLVILIPHGHADAYIFVREV